ncbi:MAG TPA: glutathione S-transferase family protein [bacterium]|nr:glutathione S-transferase family protein [bacterium]
MITLYGITRSRALRCLWMLEELGLEYRRELVAQADVKNPDYLKINPNAHIPALDDNGLILFESLAINLYLADKYAEQAGTGLWPKTAEDRGRCYQWSIWAMTELEGPALEVLQHRALLPEDKRDAGAAQKAEQRLAKPLGVLNAALAERPYLLGDAFTVADLNVSSVANWVERAKVPLAPYPKMEDWLKRCMERPTFRQALKA